MPLAKVPLGKDAVKLGHPMRAVGAKATSIPKSEKTIQATPCREGRSRGLDLFISRP